MYHFFLSLPKSSFFAFFWGAYIGAYKYDLWSSFKNFGSMLKPVLLTRHLPLSLSRILLRIKSSNYSHCIHLLVNLPQKQVHPQLKSARFGQSNPRPYNSAVVSVVMQFSQARAFLVFYSSVFRDFFNLFFSDECIFFNLFFSDECIFCTLQETLFIDTSSWLLLRMDVYAQTIGGELMDKFSFFDVF